MKILHITKKYPNALGGDSVVVSNLEKLQQQQGNDVAVLTSNCDEIVADKTHYKFGLRDKPAALDTITPRRLLSLGMLVFKSFKVIRKERPDVIHTHSIDMAFAASFAARWYKVPMIHTFHILTFPDAHHGLVRRKTELLFLRGARPQMVTVPNAADVKHLQDAGVMNARLMPNGIDLAFWKKRKRSHDIFTFISVARIEEQKGIEYLVRAVAALRRNTKTPFKVVVAGEGSLKSELEKLAGKLKVSSQIEFVGHKSPGEVRDLYAASDVAVIPSLWESGPITAYEAWCMELPLVITKVGMFANESDNSMRAAIVPAADHQALAVMMEQLLSDKQLRDRLITAGHKEAMGYGWAATNKIAASVYNEAMSDPTADLIAQLSQISKRAVVTGASVVSLALLALASFLPATINTLLTLPLVTFMPGILLAIINWPQQSKKPALMATLATAVGLLLIGLEGATLNWLLPIFGIHEPLQTRYLAPLHFLITVILLIFYLRKPRHEYAPAVVLPTRRQLLFTILPLLLPIVSAAGVFRQNNGVGNLVTLIDFVLVAIMAIWYIWKPRLWNASWLLFNVALALLFTTSLRSWYVGGFDVSQEFQVYTMVLQHHYWNLHALPGNAYNACLSLTTLPVALQQFTHVGPSVIFKFFYQAVFALTAVLSYLIARRFVHRRLAFVAAMLYVAQAQFIDTMPQIVRQEIGFLFFGLLAYYLFDRAELTKRRRSLLLTLSLGMALMHYSTTYIAILTFGASALFIWIARLLHWRIPRVPKLHSHVKPMTLIRLAILLLVFSTLWYVQINHGSSDAYATLRKTLHIPHNLRLDTTTNKAQVLLGGSTNIANPKNVAQYASSLHITSKVSVATVAGMRVKSHLGVALAGGVRTVVSIVLKLALPVSPILLLVRKKTRDDATALSFVSLGAIAVFIAVIVLPALSASYNFQRVYQQCLLILTVSGMWALWELLPLKNRLKTAVLAAFTISFFLFSPGSALINQFVGGSAPRMTFNSYGEEYDQYYVNEADTLSAAWLGQHCEGEAAWADKYASLRLTAYGSIPFNSIRNDVLAASEGCLYLDTTNVQDSLYYADYKDLTVRYTTPASSFANDDLIYTNGNSEVYQYVGR